MPNGFDVANLLLPGTYVTASVAYLIAVPLVMSACGLLVILGVLSLKRDVIL